MAPSATKHFVIPAAGIDIGFYSTKFTYGESLSHTGTQILADQFPSLAPQMAHKRLPHLPTSAALDGAVVSIDKVDYFVGKDVLSMVGAAGGVRAASDNYCQTPTYRALLLGAFYYMAQQNEVTGSLVIDYLTMGLPLTTVFSHNQFVKDMALGENTIPCPGHPGRTIKVIVNNVTVIAQPQGAMVNYTNGLSSPVKPNEKALVLDMGGGTFDWFVCNGKFQPNYSLCGAAPIGVLACAGAICERIKPGLRADPSTLDKVDLALRNGDKTVRITGVDYPLADYWQFGSSLIEQALDQMQKQVGNLVGFDHILLTGGGANLLAMVVKSTLTNYARITVRDDDPVLSNVLGFHAVSKMMRAAGV